VNPAIEPRRGFTPPRFRVNPQGTPLVPLCTHDGAPVASPLTLRMAHDAEALFLVVTGEADACLNPTLPPDSPDFWRLDHVELRLLRAPGEHLQIITTLDGRCWDSAGYWRTGEAIRVENRGAGNRRDLRIRVDRAACNLSGDIFHGLAALVRWQGRCMEIAACTPTELGFNQEERFAEFVLAEAEAPYLTAVEPHQGGATLTVYNPGPPVAGALTLQCGDIVHAMWVSLDTGESTDINAAFPRVPRRFTRVALTLDGCDLGAVTLRGELPPLPDLMPRTHPYLYFDDAGLAEFRRKAALPVFHALAARLVVQPDDLVDDHLPPPGGSFSFDFDATSMHWGRVARETMLRDGAGNRRPDAARIWSLLSPEAQEAFRATAASGATDPALLEILVPACNALLRRRDLYIPEAFGHVRVPPEGQALLARYAELDDATLLMCNRILLQSSIECCHKFKVELAGRVGGYLQKWLLSGDSRLITLATRTAQAAADSMIPEATFHLHEGNAAPGVALAYDTFYPYLTEEARGHWRRLLVKLLDLYLHSAREGAWTVTAIPNANPVSNAGAGFLALALWHEEPEKAREALAWVRRYVTRWLDYCFGDDGGNTEGCQYWQYGTESWVRFAALFTRIFGTDDGLLDHPALRNGMNMIRVALCNDGALHGVNDTVPVPCGAELAWFWAARYHDPFALWYGDHAVRWHAAADGQPYAPAAMWCLLFRPDAPESLAQPEPLPLAFALHSIEYGILRSEAMWHGRWTAGVKGARPPYTHHNQADCGAIFVDLRGERLLIDPGYYKGSATDHCLPVIDGVGPEPAQRYTGRLTACREIGDLRLLSCDATAAYRGAALRAVRHLVLVGDEALVLLDDLVPARPGAEITAHYQCGGVTKAVAGGVLIHGTQARMQMQLLSHATPCLLHPERSLHDIHWGYHFAKCRLFPVTCTWLADGQPLVTCLLDATDHPAEPATLHREGNQLTVTLPSGRAIAFTCNANGWEPAGEAVAVPNS
jgi:hypothetical protein